MNSDASITSTNESLSPQALDINGSLHCHTQITNKNGTEYTNNKDNSNRRRTHLQLHQHIPYIWIPRTRPRRCTTQPTQSATPDWTVRLSILRSRLGKRSRSSNPGLRTLDLFGDTRSSMLSPGTLHRNGLNSVNGTGQINKLPGFPSLVDDATPSDALTRVGSDGKSYNLVFTTNSNAMEGLSIRR